jgi:hypothetical protein
LPKAAASDALPRAQLVVQAGGGERERGAGARLAAVVVDLRLDTGDLGLKAGGGTLQLAEGGDVR